MKLIIILFSKQTFLLQITARFQWILKKKPFLSQNIFRNSAFFFFLE